MASRAPLMAALVPLGRCSLIVVRKYGIHPVLSQVADYRKIYTSNNLEMQATQRELLLKARSESILAVTALRKWPKQHYSGEGGNGDDRKSSKKRESSFQDPEFRKKFAALLAMFVAGGGSALLLWTLQSRFDNLVSVFEDTKANAEKVYPFDPAEVEFFLKKHCHYLLPKKFQSTPIAWEYLQELSKGGTRREAAISKIAKMENLSEAECSAFASSLDTEAAVAIAHGGGDPRLFPPPPTCIGPKEGFKAYYGGAFRSILDPLPEDNIHYNLNYLYREAIETYLPNEEEELNHFIDLYSGFDESPILEMTPPEISEVRFLKVCLLALISHSRNPKMLALMPTSELLELMIVISEKYKDNVDMQSYVLKVLANLTCDKKYSGDIKRSGCLHLLAKASRSNDGRLILPAKRALHNLDRDHCEHRLPSGIYQLHPDVPVDEALIEYDIVFIHGILGSATRTWRQLDEDIGNIKIPQKKKAPSLKDKYLPGKSGFLWRLFFESNDDGSRTEDNYPSRVVLEDGTVIEFEEDIELNEDDVQCDPTQCWPRDWLPKDCPKARVIAVDFDSFVTHWSAYCPVETTNITLKARADELLTKLHKAGVGSRPIIWVTHSMGGLIAKNMLITAAKDKTYRNVLKNTKGMVFCSVPHVGSYLAFARSGKRYMFLPTEEAMQLTDIDKKLSKMHEVFTTKIYEPYKFRVLSFGEMLETRGAFDIPFKLVPFFSADPGMGTFYKVNLNHLDVCKPCSRGSFVYREIVKLILKVGEDGQKDKKQKKP